MPGASVSRCKNFQCLPRWKLHVSNICGLVCDSLAGMKAVRHGIAFVRLCIRNTPMRLVALYIKPLEFAQKKMGCFVEVVILAGAFRKMIRPPRSIYSPSHAEAKHRPSACHALLWELPTSQPGSGQARMSAHAACLVVQFPVEGLQLVHLFLFSHFRGYWNEQSCYTLLRYLDTADFVCDFKKMSFSGNLVCLDDLLTILMIFFPALNM